MASTSGKSGAGAAKKRVTRKRPAKKDEATEVEAEASGPAKAEPATLRSATVVEPTLVTRTTRGVRTRDVNSFLRQLIMLLDAGTPILKSLNSLASRSGRPGVRNLVTGIKQSVEAGNPLWQAFAREDDRLFSPVFVNLIKASEASGTLSTVLGRLTTFQEKRELLARRVRSAMLYPTVLVIACFLVVVLISSFVIPEFREIFDSMGIELSPFTATFMGGAEALAEYWWTAFVFCGAVYAFYKFVWIRNPIRRRSADRLIMRIPIVGSIVKRSAVADFCRTYAMLLRSGLSMMVTLDLCKNSVTNRALVDIIQDMRDSVERGDGLEQPLRAAERRHVFPGVVADMLVTGEETGTIDKVADQIATTYEEEVEIDVNGLGEAIQPAITVFMGMVVLAIAVALFQPIIEMVSQITAGNM